MERFLPRFFVIFAVIVGLSACYPETKYPLSNEENSFDDVDLPGLWFGGALDEPEDHHYYSFLRVGDDKEIDVVGLQFDSDGDEWLTMALHTTNIDDKTYMSVRFTGENGEPGDGWEQYILCRYEIENGTRLSIWVAGEEELKAILADNLTSEGQMSDIIDDDGKIIAPMGVLRDAVRGADANVLFEDLIGVYERVS